MPSGSGRRRPDPLGIAEPLDPVTGPWVPPSHHPVTRLAPSPGCPGRAGSLWLADCPVDLCEGGWER